jgi:hypothetical protein
MVNIRLNIILLILTIIIIFYGGKNNINMIEYNSNYFNNYKNVIIFEKVLKKYIPKFDNIVTNNSDYSTIDEIINTLNIIIPNYINNYFIKIKPYSYFNTTKIINNTNNLLMIIFNINYVNNLDLLIEKENNIGYFYNLTNKISITNIYDIYNNNNAEIYITIFTIKKPYWYY